MKKGVKGNHGTRKWLSTVELRAQEGKEVPPNIFKSMRFLVKHPRFILVIESFIPSNKLSRLYKATTKLVRDLFTSPFDLRCYEYVYV